MTPTVDDAEVVLAASATTAPTALTSTVEPTDTERSATATTEFTTVPVTVTDRVVRSTVEPTVLVGTDSDGEGEGQVLLVYDDNSLALLNRSDEPVDISDWTFVQPVEEGRDLSFSTLRWGDGSAPTDALPAGDCFQVWTTRVAEQDVPGRCNVRHKWDQASFPRWFWISDTPEAIFEVRRGGIVLAQCQVDDGECVVDVG
jgi:hypothetical protein